MAKVAHKWPPYPAPKLSPAKPRHPSDRRNMSDLISSPVMVGPYYTQPDLVGRYIDLETRQDITGECRSGAIIKVLPDGRPSFQVSISTDPNNTGYNDGETVIINLFNKHRGAKWEWQQAPQGYENVEVLAQAVTHEYRFLCLEIVVEHSLNLSHYPWKPDEPRLRPTTHGAVETGSVAGLVLSVGRIFPVFDKIYVYRDEK